MNVLVDLVLLGIIGLFVLRGHKHGAVSTLLSLLEKLLSTFVAFLLAPVLSSPLSKHVVTPALSSSLKGLPQGAKEKLCEMLSFAVAFLLLLLVIHLCMKLVIHLTEKLNKLPVFGNVNQKLGIVFGLLLGLLWAWIVCAVLSLALPPLAEATDLFSAFNEEKTILFRLLRLVNPFTLLATHVFQLHV